MRFFISGVSGRCVGAAPAGFMPGGGGGGGGGAFAGRFPGNAEVRFGGPAAADWVLGDSTRPGGGPGGGPGGTIRCFERLCELFCFCTFFGELFWERRPGGGVEGGFGPTLFRDFSIPGGGGPDGGLGPFAALSIPGGGGPGGGLGPLATDAALLVPGGGGPGGGLGPLAAPLVALSTPGGAIAAEGGASDSLTIFAAVPAGGGPEGGFGCFAIFNLSPMPGSLTRFTAPVSGDEISRPGGGLGVLRSRTGGVEACLFDLEEFGRKRKFPFCFLCRLSMETGRCPAVFCWGESSSPGGGGMFGKRLFIVSGSAAIFGERYPMVL